MVTLGLENLVFFFVYRLFLLRHGKAVKFTDDSSDFGRHLNKLGTAQVNQIGYILKNEGLNIDYILSSGAVRTTETAEIMNHYLGLSSIDFDDTLYLADRKVIFERVETVSRGKSLLYVGHNNGISDFASYLTGESILMSTSQLVEIHFQVSSWKEISKDMGIIARVIKPDVLAF